jgi:hypothetical protein
VKSYTGGLRVALASLVMLGALGMTGCGADNEAEATKAKPLGDPGPPAANSKVVTPRPPAQTQEEHYKRQTENFKRPTPR